LLWELTEDTQQALVKVERAMDPQHPVQLSILHSPSMPMGYFGNCRGCWNGYTWVTLLLSFLHQVMSW
jgi:hypothetical protein